MIINGLQFTVGLQDILQELVLQLRANNIDYLQKTFETENYIQVTCPYHANGLERRPSAGIRKSDGLFHCFACSEVHTLQEVITHCFGHTDDIIGVFGWNWLLKNFLTIRQEERKNVSLDLARNSSNHNLDIYDYVSEAELEKYRYYHPYMYKRRLTDEIIDLFDIGYDKETQCITFPIRDIYGRCLFVARRSVKTKWFNYPAGVEKPLYGIYELQKSILYYDYWEGDWDLIVCESMLDALTCWVYGKYAVALNGLGTYNQFRQLSNLSVRKFILATDNDTAGLKARERIRENIKNKIITEYILPKGKKDINELTKEEFENLEEVL